MSLRRTVLTLSLTLLLASAAARPASADLVLGFSAPTYTINDIGQIATVGITLSQTAAGPQVGVGNALLTAAVQVTYTPTVGIVNLNSINAPGWDNLSNGPAGSPLTLSVVSLLGTSSLPTTIANLTFQGVGPGVVTLTVRQLDLDSPDFISEQGNIIDPTNTATATVTVLNAAIPEPSPLALGFLMMGAAAAYRRLRRTRVAA